MTIHIALVEGRRDTTPQTCVTTWGELIERCSAHVLTPDKDAAGGYVPALIREGGRRVDDDVEEVTLGVLDYDGITDAQLEVVLEQLEGYACILHTTWSHGSKYAPRGLHGCRLLLPLQQPVPRDQWLEAWAALNAHFGGFADPSAKNLSRFYYWPSCPAKEETHAWRVLVEDGEWIDYRFAVAAQRESTVSVIEIVTPSSHTERIELEDLKRLSSNWLDGRNKNPEKQKWGRILRSLCKGEAYADEGERHNVTLALTARVTHKFQDADPTYLAAHFAASLQAMGEGAPTLDEVAGMIRDYRAKLGQKRQERAQQQQERVEQERNELEDTICQAFEAIGVTERSDSYTEDELDKIAEKLEISRVRLQRRWIVQHADWFYFFVLDRYVGPYPRSSAMSRAKILLAPATESGEVIFYVEDDKGRVRAKSLQDLVSDHGTVVKRVEASLVAQTTYYDSARDLIVEAVCPLRKLEPQHDEEVAKWLELLGGDTHDKLLDWLAAVTKLEVPNTILLLEGIPGCGKSLLARGLARLWTTGRPTSIARVMRNFNAGVTRCPLVFGDEGIPKDSRGNPRTSELRELITEFYQEVEPKYREPMTLVGAIRGIVAANNPALFSSSEHHTSDDIEALCQRFVAIEVRHRAAVEYLGEADTTRFVAGDAIAQHVLWLRDNREVTWGKRFPVEPTNNIIRRKLVAGTGMLSDVKQWCVGHLLSPHSIVDDPRLQRHARVKDGELYVTSRLLHEQWDKHVHSHMRAPSVGRIGRALAGLGRGRTCFRIGKNMNLDLYHVHSEDLIDWAVEHGYADRETLEQALASPKDILNPKQTRIKYGQDN